MSVTIYGLLLLVTLCVTVHGRCPKDCYCSEGVVECSLVTEFPLGLDNDTIKISIAQMNVVSIPRNAFNYLPLLREVEFVQGNVKEIAACAFKDMPSIDTIKFEKTVIALIQSYAFSGLDNVSNIVFTNSKIGYMDSFAFFQLRNVITFNVLYSTIDYMSAGSFYDVQGVKVMLFSNNNISDVRTGAFNDVKTSIFHVMTNTFWNMDCGVLHEMNDTAVGPFEFIGNSYYCNCSTDWLLNKEGKEIYVKFMNTTKCHGPSALKTKTINDVSFKDIGCRRRISGHIIECQKERLIPKPRCTAPATDDDDDDSSDDKSRASSLVLDSLITWFVLSMIAVRSFHV